MAGVGSLERSKILRNNAIFVKEKARYSDTILLRKFDSDSTTDYLPALLYVSLEEPKGVFLFWHFTSSPFFDKKKHVILTPFCYAN